MAEPSLTFLESAAPLYSNDTAPNECRKKTLRPSDPSSDSLETSKNSGCQSKVKILRQGRQKSQAQLVEATRTLSRLREPHKVFKNIIQAAVEFTGAERGFLLIVEDEDLSPNKPFAGLRPVASVQIPLGSLDGVRFRAARTVIHGAVSRKQTVRFNELQEGEEVHNSIAQFGVRSILAEPLLVGGEIVGVLYLDTRDPAAFRCGQMDSFPNFSAHVAICLENVRLVQEREAALRRQHAEHARLLEQKAGDHAMRRFLRAANHELKGSLSILQTGLALLKRHQDSQELGTVLEDMETALARTTRLTHDFLNMESVQAGATPELLRGEVSLTELVLKEIKLLQRQLGTEQKKAFHFDLRMETEATVWADRNRLSQILANLLSNAAKYSPQGGTISVTHRRLQGNDIIRVRDRGTGMSSETRKKALQPYSEATSPDPKETRLGLGLYLVRQLVEAHGGALDIESELGEGTTAWVVFPRPKELFPSAEGLLQEG